MCRSRSTGRAVGFFRPADLVGVSMVPVTPDDPSTAKGSIEVPGGIVLIDINRGRRPASTWLKALGLTFLRGGYSSRGVDQDVVVMDSGRTNELYREGPYDGVTVGSALAGIVRDIQRCGLDEFVRSRRIETGQLGPVRVPSGRPTYAGYLKAWLATQRRRSR